MGTGTRNIAIGQESGGLFVVILLRGLLNKYPFIVKGLKKFRCGFMMYLVGGTGVNIKRDPKILKCLFIDPVIAVHHLLGGDSFLTCLQGDGYPMFVRSADGDHISVPLAQVADINVGGDINPRQVAQVKGAVGIGQGRCNQCSFVGFSSHCE